MKFGDFFGARAGRKAIFLLLSLTAVLLGASGQALAIDCVADAGGIVDGFVNYPIPPAQINLDGNCIIRNYTASNPMTSNFSFLGPPRGLLIIFDNVVFTGNMSCNAVHEHKLWFVNGSTSGLRPSCQNILIPVEKIQKANPPGPPFVAIGVPFTWTLTIPVLFDPKTGTVINFQGSVNDLHSITIRDDLNATGVDLTYVSHTMTWLDDGQPVPHTFSNVGNLLSFDNIPIVAAGRQFAINLTVVLNNTPVNAPGTQFINTARWDFGRLIDGTFYEPLPGENGISPPLTIGGPVLVMDKTGPATMNLGQWGTFGLDVQNTGQIDAWDVALRDLFPDGATGGMCDTQPEILNARVFAADGVTPVAGKGPLVQGTDYTFNYTGPPTCRLDLTMLTPAGRIGPSERLRVSYRTQLDGDTLNGVALTNVAGAVQWFNGNSSNAARITFNRTLTNGTVGILDHEDAHTVTTLLQGYIFTKAVQDLTSGANPATTAAPGDTLRYTLTFRTTDSALNNFRIVDEIDAMNVPPAFVAGSLALVTVPPGADVSNTNPTGGSNGTGVLDIRNLSLPINSQLVIQFDVTLRGVLPNGTVVSDQSAARLSSNALVTVSDDPNVNGIADPLVPGDEDPTRLTIVSAPSLVIQKTSTDLTGDPLVLLVGDTLLYSITVRNAGNADAVNVVLRDAVPPANTTYVAGSTTLNGAAVADVAGLSPLVNGLLIHPPSDPTPGSMPADVPPNPNNTATITFTVVVSPATPNGTVISNQGFVTAPAAGIVNQPSDDPGTPAPNDPTLDVVGYRVFFDKTVADLTSGLNPATTAAPGDTLRYTLTFRTTDQALANFRIVDEIDAMNVPPAFVAGSLALVTVPPGADVSNTNPAGGANGTGVIDIRNLNLAVNSQLVIQFDVTLRSVLPNGMVVSDQSSARLPDNTVIAPSDDPNVNGTADPFVPGDEDPTRLTIVSAPSFVIQKISTDLTGDPLVLLAGETLRYTITVRNAGNADAVNVVLRDAVPPANTTYVAGSTTLNGAAVADVAGLSPLVNGLLIHPPSDPTPGSMPADVPPNPNNTATITFDVVVIPTTPNGTVLSNQGFVTAAASGIVDQPSDDPDTPTPNDPTRDIVGNLPLLFAAKSATLVVDLGTPGIVDPGDTLRYTITIDNSGSIAATGVVLTDPVPANTTYVADTTRLNGLPVGQPDLGNAPLASGIDISSSDLTPPLPGPGAGVISPGGVAVLQYDLLVNPGTPAGTLIINQAVVATVEVPDLPTDGDGDPATGPEPTIVVVGDVQQLTITKQVTVVGGGPALPGATLEYVVTVTNNSPVPALNVVITDDLNASVPGQLAYVGGSATMNGGVAGVSVAGSTITANYAAVNGALPPLGVVVLRFRAVLNPGLAIGTVVTNTGVVAWSTPTETASASVSIVVGNIPGYAVLRGSAWHDADFDDAQDAGERPLAGWTVELYRDLVLSNTALTDAAGGYLFVGVEPNDTNGVQYELRFRAPGAGASTAMLGRASSPFTNGLQRISAIVAPTGADIAGLNLPIDPNGVVYNTLARTPVPGATVALQAAGTGTPLPAACFDDPNQQDQITLADGWYKFDLNFSDPACPSGADYLVVVTPPAGAFAPGPSQIIPPASGPATPAFSVPACPGSASDVIPGTVLFCEVQGSEQAPAPAVPPASAGTIYHLHILADSSQPPGSSQIFNNHIPVDPLVSGSLAISKTTPLLSVTRGQLVPYEIAVHNTSGSLITDVSLLDSFPAGFSYVPGSARLDGVPTEPVVSGLTLRWDGLVFAGTQSHTVQLLLAVGAGVGEGEFVNRAQLFLSLTGAAISGEATATVRIVPDATFDCTDVLGKVFDDRNRNRKQDDGEVGLPGVRVITDRGLAATTDAYGRYHITCAIVPNENRGSNFVLKLDDRTLPSGFRLSTDQTAIRRATRGKALRIDYGASIHRTVAVDLSDAAFEPGSTDLRVQWRPRLDLLLQELRKAPAVLRLSYLADTEDAGLVERRLKAIKRQVAEAWDPKTSYPLVIEPEIFWRRGGPAGKPAVQPTGER